MNKTNMALECMDEVYFSKLSILESSRGTRPGVLSTVEGPFLEAGQKNRNVRSYSRSLIENKILNSPYTQELIKNRLLLGEAKHPKDRMEIKIEESSHNITRLWLDGDILYGQADILDTPAGRVIQTLLDYGSKIGISARASGSVSRSDGENEVDEENYNFKTFDFVPYPSFEKSRLVMNESVQDANDMLNSLKEAILKITDNSGLKIIASILESVEGEEVETLNKMISEKEKELEGFETEEDESLVEGLLREMRDDIQLKDSLIEEYSTECSRMCEEIISLKDQNSRMQSTLIDNLEDGDPEEDQEVNIDSDIISSYQSTVESQREQIDKLNGIILSLKSQLEESNLLIIDISDSYENALEGLQKKMIKSEQITESVQDMKLPEVVSVKKKKVPILEEVTHSGTVQASVKDSSIYTETRLSKMLIKQFGGNK